MSFSVSVFGENPLIFWILGGGGGTTVVAGTVAAVVGVAAAVVSTGGVSTAGGSCRWWEGGERKVGIVIEKRVELSCSIRTLGELFRYVITFKVRENRHSETSQ